MSAPPDKRQSRWRKRPREREPWLLKSLYVQVMIGLFGGILVGYLFPQSADLLKPLGDLFIKAIKMVIGPVVLCTIVVGVAHVGSAKQVGRLGGKALVYFEVVTTLALVIGLVVANVFQPGRGINAVRTATDTSSLMLISRAAARMELSTRP